jgi:uncharacterized protein (DUF1015 family)
MAEVTPFRAVRYTGAAGDLADLVAPPYDAVDDEERARLYTRSPYNVVHVTLPESAAEAGRLYRDWLASGILAWDDDEAMWLAAERYVGPDGVERERHGVIGSVAAEPYATGGVLPHERTYPRIRDERLELLRATRVQPEPLLLLAAGTPAPAIPEREPDLEADGTRLWRGEDREGIDVGQLLVADGHHRYESAVELGRELGAWSRIMALVVSVDDPGLEIFPTHRVFVGRPDLSELPRGERVADLDEGLAALEREPRDRSAAVVYRPGRVELVRGPEGDLDAALVDRHGLDGIGYTTHAREAAAAVDRGDADVAFVVRAPLVDDAFAVARRGERMPAKSTYFTPKPLSGLVFHPLER